MVKYVEWASFVEFYDSLKNLLAHVENENHKTDSYGQAFFCARLGLHRYKAQKFFYARVQSSKKYLCTNF